MKKISTFLSVFFLSIFLMSGSAFAYTTTYEPTPSDVYDLDHDYAYEWGIDANDVLDYTENGEIITSVTLTFSNIQNYWGGTDEDRLFITLLDTLGGGLGLTSYVDTTEGIVNYFDSSGLLLEALIISNWKSTIAYSLSPSEIFALTDYLIANDGLLGIGFDPDCHYYNDGVSLTIVTSPVPEPATMLLLGTGLLGLAGLSRKKIQK